MSSSFSCTYPAPVVVPAKGEHKCSLIMLHGLGDTGAGWTDISYMFGEALPHVKFIFPTAPTRPITINMGMRMPGWYDINSLNSIDQRVDREGLLDSSSYVEKLVEDENKAGIEYSKIAVGGFSQGGAVALTSLMWKKKIAAIVGLSCYLPLKDENPFVSAENLATPIFMAHGNQDDVVQYQYGQGSSELLKSAGLNVEFHTIPGMGHSANQDELLMMKDFLLKHLT
eukprot:TRINITY_DN26034_c0_g2_i3.p1 TRINITY_DN26034_c0_g2~~TRINITY_DN26034_c0_g2_i3.p1  ORF type:complete len:264 (-),score=41.28 TRINITY_DN26034_c0_g2_i3:595-1275(-)